MEQTTFMKINYPGEYQEPFWDAYLSQMEMIDQALFMNKLQNNLFVGGGDTPSQPILFDSGSNTLTWFSDFVIPIFHFGYKLTVPYGPSGNTRTATILDGYAIVVNIPFTLTANTPISMQVLSQLTPLNHQQWVMAWRSGKNVYFKGMAQVTG